MNSAKVRIVGDEDCASRTKGRYGVEGVGRLQTRLGAQAGDIIPQLARGRDQAHLWRGENGPKGCCEIGIALPVLGRTKVSAMDQFTAYNSELSCRPLAATQEPIE